MRCPRCQLPHIKRNGHAYYGKQNYQCKLCDRQFVIRRETVAPDKPELIKSLLLERISLCGICRVLKVSLTWLLNFIEQQYQQTPADLRFVEPAAAEIKYLDSLANESAGDLILQADLATAYEKVGILQGDSRKPSLSDFRGAIASLQKAQAIRRRLLENNPNDAENRRLLAENLRLLGLRRAYQNDIEGGFRDSREAVQIYERLITENPDSLALQKASLELQIEDATGYSDVGKYAEAIPLFQNAADKIEYLRRLNANDADIERIQAKCLTSLAIPLSWESRQREAEAAMTRGVEIAESLAARYPNDANFRQDVYKFYLLASNIYEEIDDQRALELCEKARKVVEDIVAVDRANAQARHNLVKIFSRLGVTAANLGKPSDALEYLEKASEILSELQEKDPLNRGYDHEVSTIYKRIGDAKYKQRELAGALEAYQESRISVEKEIENDPAKHSRFARPGNRLQKCRFCSW